MQLRLARRLVQELRQALFVDWPRSDERLVGEILEVAVRVTVGSVTVIVLGPASDRGFPLARNFGNDVQSRPDIAAALRVVGRQGDHCCGAGGCDVRAPFVKCVDPASKRARVTADLVERNQPVVAVERGVLHALGHHRRRELLKARGELFLELAAAIQQQHVGDQRQQLTVDIRPPPARLLHCVSNFSAVLLARAGTNGHVRPVNAEPGPYLGHGLPHLAVRPVAVPAVGFADLVHQRRQSPEVRVQVARDDLVFRRSRHLDVRLRLTSEGVIERRHRRLVVCVHENAVHDRDEVVAGGALNRE